MSMVDGFANAKDMGDMMEHQENGPNETKRAAKAVKDKAAQDIIDAQVAAVEQARKAIIQNVDDIKDMYSRVLTILNQPGGIRQQMGEREKDLNDVNERDMKDATLLPAADKANLPGLITRFKNIKAQIVAEYGKISGLASQKLGAITEAALKQREAEAKAAFAAYNSAIVSLAPISNEIKALAIRADYLANLKAGLVMVKANLDAENNKYGALAAPIKGALDLPANNYKAEADGLLLRIANITAMSPEKRVENKDTIYKDVLDAKSTIGTFIDEYKVAMAAAPADVKSPTIRAATLPVFTIGGMRGNLNYEYKVTGTPTPKELYINDFRAENMFFFLTIKAMAAKVLTVVGVYDIFDRYNPIASLTPIRQIVGGADDSMAPEVIADATELYFRLPRLVEFYLDFLQFDKGTLGTGDDSAKSIALIPELDGEFSELIKMIFLRTEGGNNKGDYSDYEMREIVKSINSVYIRYKEKAGEKANAAAVLALVQEVNRRYGIVKKGEWNKYSNYIKQQRRKEYEEMLGTDYTVLPGEGDVDYPKSSPSDRFVTPGSISGISGAPGKYNLDGPDMVYYSMLLKFRKELQNKFADFTGDPTTLSYAPLIKQAQSEIQKAKGSGEKFEVAKKLIVGTGLFLGADINKTFMFHETVVYGLNILDGVYTMLSGFKESMRACNIRKLQEAIVDEYKATAGTGNMTRDTILARFKNSCTPKLGDAYNQISGDFIGRAADFYDGRGGIGRAPGAGAGTKLNADDLMGYLKAVGAPTDVHYKIAKRFLIDTHSVMEYYLSNIYLLVSNFQGLVDVKFYSSGSLKAHLDFSKLRDMIERTIQDLKYYMDLFRPHINKEILEKYEKQINTGSLYWLESNLIDGLIKGLPLGTVGESGKAEFETLDNLTKLVNDTFTILTEDTKIYCTVDDMKSLAATSPTFEEKTDTSPQMLSYENYGAVFAKLIYYDSSKRAPVFKAKGGNETIELTKDSYPIKLMNPVAPKKIGEAETPVVLVSANPARRRNFYSSAAGFTTDTSLFILFNQIVAKYLKQFYDPPTTKIYQNLINSFVNGVFSKALTTPNSSWPDISIDATINKIGDINSETVLLSSLAIMLLRLTRDLNPRTQASEHLVANLTDIPLYMKENYRANLPIFTKLFDTVSGFGGFLKQVIQKSDIKLGRPELSISTIRVLAGPISANLKALGNGNSQITDDNKEYPVNYNISKIDTIGDIKSQADTDAGMRKKFLNIIETISNGAYTLSSTTTDVLRELADDPKFFQTNEGSIEIYKTRNGKPPLMPISLTTYVLKTHGTNYKDFMPDYTLGDPNFKYLYGTRGIFSKNVQNITYDKIPGVKNIVDTYNGSLQKRDQVDPERYLKYINGSISLLKFLFDTTYYSNRILPRQNFTFARIEFTGNANNAVWANVTSSLGTGLDEKTSIRAYEVKNDSEDLTTVLDIVETNDQDSKVGAIGKIVGISDPTKANNRPMEWYLNIIELNISPINVHAMMREMPLVNIYNYSYTFDQLTEELFGTRILDESKDRADIKSSKSMFVNLLGDPYMRISQEEYGHDARVNGTAGLIRRLFVGDSGLQGLARPKFLSDQVFNKALFGSMLPSSNLEDEAGLTAASAIARGRDGWDTKNHLPNLSDAGVLPADRETTLVYLNKNNKGVTQPGTKNLGSVEKKSYLQNVGKFRFDSVLVRNIFFIMNIWRVLRLKLDKELTQYHSVVTRGSKLVNPSLTEYDRDSYGQYETASYALDKKYLETQGKNL